MLANQSAKAAASVGPLDLLDGLEGFPAQQLHHVFNRSKKHFYIVHKISDDAGSEMEWGTLRHAVASAVSAKKEEMTWIVFDPDVFAPAKNESIELNEALELSSNTIIDGRGAKVTICSTKDVHLLKICGAKNVILRNLILHKVAPFVRDKPGKGIVFPVTLRPGFSPERAAKGIDRDGIPIREGSDNIWIDHCTFFLCGDECISARGDASVAHTNITVSWCDFSDQYYAALIGHTKEESAVDERIRFTFHHNKSTDCARRSPRINRATADVYNNYLNGWVDWGMAANAHSRVLVEANVFQAKQSTMAISVGTGTHIKGFVRLRNNMLLNGAELDSHMPHEVPEAPYKRKVDKADNGLRELLNRETGWQNMVVDFSSLTGREQSTKR